MKASLTIEMEGDQLQITTTFDPKIDDLPEDQVLPLPHLLVQQMFTDILELKNEEEEES